VAAKSRAALVSVRGSQGIRWARAIASSYSPASFAAANCFEQLKGDRVGQ
jgi:hypothetical protein